MEAYNVTQLGKISDIGKNYENGMAFLHDALKLTSCEVSVSFMPAGSKEPFNHKHKQNEEVYIFLKGDGSMVLDGVKVAFTEGTCIRVSPTTVRTMEAVTDTVVVCIQAKANSLEQFSFGDGELC